MKKMHTYITIATLAGQPGCYRWGQLGVQGVCMSSDNIRG